jgi:hypothetical protein
VATFTSRIDAATSTVDASISRIDACASIYNSIDIEYKEE